MVMRWIANPFYSGSIPLPLFSGRDGMVDMSGLDSGNDLLCGFKSHRPYFLEFILIIFW